MTPYRSWRYLLPYGAVYLSFSIAMGALSTTENFRVPGNSMAPTIIEGDRIMADTSAFRNGSPRPGDLVIFRYPKDRSVTFIKRIVGLPGDKIEFCGLGLFRNGMEVPSRVVSERDGMKILEETLENASYEILLEGHQAPKNEVSAFIVPADQYFVLGDNRDQSSDSRVWGSVKREDLLGKPAFAWLSWDKERHRNRWERLFKRLE
jgi:signal peptidase I